MTHPTFAQFLGLLVVMLAAARLCGALAKAVGQPTVLGELVVGVARLFSAVALMVMVTTFLAPPLLRLLFPPKDPSFVPPKSVGIEELVTGIR
jgi:Kef-type K+ transport system membrane component KefB